MMDKNQIDDMNDEIIEVRIDKLKLDENSRARVEENLSELMESIKQIGLIQPITIRKKDYLVICGNRRLTACKKLGYKTIKAVVKDNVDDEDVLVMNLTENIQRKNINSIEIGRICQILAEKGLSLQEISSRLGISSGRVKICLSAYKQTPKEFRDKVTYVGLTRGNAGMISESTFWAIMHLNRIKKLTSTELGLVMQEAIERQWGSAIIYNIELQMKGGTSVLQAMKKIQMK